MSDYIKNLFSLANKTILITGASKGIGEAIAIGCKNAGANIVCFARSSNPNSNELAGNYKQCDIKDTILFEKIVHETAANFGSIHALINVAAITLPTNKKNEYDRFSETLSINLDSVYRCCEVASKFISNGGSILNVSSIAGLQGFPNNPGYVASKGGLRMLTKALAIDYANKGINVNCLVPGYIKTNMTKTSYDNPNAYSERLKRMIIKRWGTPEDLVGASIFLLSNASNYITGTDLVVDGGWTAKGL